jgi:hypothetical protein
MRAGFPVYHFVWISFGRRNLASKFHWRLAWIGTTTDTHTTSSNHVPAWNREVRGCSDWLLQYETPCKFPLRSFELSSRLIGQMAEVFAEMLAGLVSRCCPTTETRFSCENENTCECNNKLSWQWLKIEEIPTSLLLILLSIDLLE